jgi:hypothetical protein
MILSKKKEDKGVIVQVFIVAVVSKSRPLKLGLGLNVSLVTFVL